MAKSSDTARLEEVRTLLHQLQRIRAEPANPDPQDGNEGKPGQTPEQPRENRSAFRSKAVKPVLMAGTTLLLLAAAVTGALLLRDKPAPENRDPPTATIQPRTSEPFSSLGETAEQHPDTGASLALLEQAQQMMLSGDILSARATLMKSADSGPPDVALALARSYDPNFLRSVTNPNASPDIEQATLWYRRWHYAAVESGQIADSLSLDPILRSMR